MSVVVVDASVVAKTLIDESDSHVAIGFLRACVMKRVRVIAPSHIQYEVASIAIKKLVPVDLVTSLFEGNILKLVCLESPNRLTWLQAEKICQAGHEKSGYPSMYDSIYHAMAIVEGGSFVTADKRHYAKSKKFGHIVLMQDWEGALNVML